MYTRKVLEENSLNGLDFRKDYVHFCFKFELCPSRCMKKLNLSRNSLDCFLDAIPSEHCLPLLNALAINKSLEGILLRSTFLEKFSREILNDCKLYDLMQLKDDNFSLKLPAILREELLSKLFTSLTNSISINQALKQLEIIGMPVTLNFMKHFSKAIESSNSIQYLSLAGCFIENEGLTVLFKSLENNVSLKILNLSSCRITPAVMKSLTTFTKFQASKRLLSAWQGSLRYQQPILDSFPGVSRLILNDNIKIGDTGVKILAEALADDLWLKAIDLQNCGITDIGAKCLLNVLVQNTSIEILDTRRNPSIDSDISDRIVEQLNLSNRGKVCEYEWLPSKKYCYSEPSGEIRKIKSIAKVTSCTKPQKEPHPVSITRMRKKKEKAGHTTREKHLCHSASQERSESASSSSSESKEVEGWMETCLQLRRELKLCLQQLEVEQGRRKLAELEIQQLKSEGKSSGMKSGYVLVDEAMLSTIQDTFTKFRYFIDFLRSSSYSFENEAMQNDLNTLSRGSVNHLSVCTNNEYSGKNEDVQSVSNNLTSAVLINSAVPTRSNVCSNYESSVGADDVPTSLFQKPSSSDDLFNIISERIHNTLTSSLNATPAMTYSIK